MKLVLAARTQAEILVVDDIERRDHHQQRLAASFDAGASSTGLIVKAPQL